MTISSALCRAKTLSIKVIRDVLYESKVDKQYAILIEFDLININCVHNTSKGMVGQR